MASDIKEIIDGLKDEDRQALMYAFEHELSYHVEFGSNQFIGVNITHIPYLYPENRVGAWNVGRIAKSRT